MCQSLRVRFQGRGRFIAISLTMLQASKQLVKSLVADGVTWANRIASRPKKEIKVCGKRAARHLTKADSFTEQGGKQEAQ